MPQHCKVCHTVNRDRARYCRGCAGRLVPSLREAPAAQAPIHTAPLPAAPLPATQLVSEVRTPVHAGAAASDRPPASQPVTASAQRRARPMLGGMLMLACAAASAAFVIEAQWRPIDGEPMASEGIPHRAAAPGGAVALDASASPAAASDPDAAALAVPSFAAEPPAPPQSLLALTVEQKLKAERHAREQLARETRVRTIHVDPAQQQLDDGDPRSAPPVDTAKVPHRRLAASRSGGTGPESRASADRPGAHPAASLATTGPCDRYNPFGEALCAHVPAVRRAAPLAGQAKQERQVVVR